MKVLVGGSATGMIMVSKSPINFLGMIQKETGVVQDVMHELHGRSLAGTMLVFPHGMGSSVGAYTIYSIKSHNVAPAAMICSRADLTVVTGCAVADIPLVIASPDETDTMVAGRNATLDTDHKSLIVH